MKVTRIEPTPNPNAIKLNLDGRIIESGSRSFESSSEAQGNELATALFQLSAIKSVFFMPTFVTVTKDPAAEWGPLVTDITNTIETNTPKVETPAEQPGAPATAKPSGPATDNDDLMRKIQEIMDTRVRPALAGDGGGLQILSLESYVLTIRYHGACGTCPSSISGTMRAIEQMLRTDVDPALMVVSA